MKLIYRLMLCAALAVALGPLAFLAWLIVTFPADCDENWEENHS